VAAPGSSVAAHDSFIRHKDEQPGDRYPGAFEQTIGVLADAGFGRFATSGLTRPKVPRPEAKLFVPQHSGLQPLPREQVALGYEQDVPCPQSTAKTCRCAQEQELLEAANAPGTGVASLGPFVAAFPIPAGSTISERAEVEGCPNWLAAEQGVHEPVKGIPPQLTGLQTTNRVRDLDGLESALFNLVLNTNGVFIELYEDVVWRASVLRGTGPEADPLSRRVPGSHCEPLPGDTELCVSKNLAQWTEELHHRRTALADQGRNGLFPGLQEPFPTEVKTTFDDAGGSYHFINPAHCDPASVDSSFAADSNAVARITVRPVGG